MAEAAFVHGVFSFCICNRCKRFCVTKSEEPNMNIGGGGGQRKQLVLIEIVKEQEFVKQEDFHFFPFSSLWGL